MAETHLAKIGHGADDPTRRDPVVKNQRPRDDRPWRDLPLLFAMFVVAIAIWYLISFNSFLYVRDFLESYPSVDLTKTGPFGDTFGVVNSLFSSLGVAGVVYALILQIREQREAREESDKAKEHSSELAMIAALVNAQAALVQAFGNEGVASFSKLIDSMDKKKDPAIIASDKHAMETTYKLMGGEIKELRCLIRHAQDKVKWDQLRPKPTEANTEEVPESGVR